MDPSSYRWGRSDCAIWNQKLGWMPVSEQNADSEFVAFAQQRLCQDSRIVQRNCSDSAMLNGLSGYDDSRDSDAAIRLIASASTNSEIHSTRLSGEMTLVALCLVEVENTDGILVLSIRADPSVAESVVKSIVETYTLSREMGTYKAALDESAMQLAQSFEEQNWLRSFARTASSFSQVSSANSMANGILQPLGFLLRAQDTYLIVNSNETERSGLVSAKYGTSSFTIETISELLTSLGMHAESVPLVRNNLAASTNDGLINSLVAVPVCGTGSELGYLVGINRSAEIHDGLPVYDPEFGSSDVGLLEEAAVLLETQAHNIHLLVQSNQMFLGSLHAMSSAIDARDPYTQGHSERVARLGFELAKIHSISEKACQEIYLSGILHDVGKIGVPDTVLLKNGPLTDEEYKIIQQHPEIGYRIVEQLGHLQFALPGVLYHHERWDGRGYPHQLAGEAIPLMARILAVADAFDAMTSSRPYRHAMPVEKAVAIINDGSGVQWDSEIVECFKIWLSEQDLITKTNSGNEEPTNVIPQDTPMEHIVQAVMVLAD